MAKDKNINIKVRTKGTKKAKKALGSVERGIGSLGQKALAAGGAFFAAQGIISGFQSVVAAAGRQEMAQKKLEQALGRTSQALLDHASALQQVSIFGDEAIIEQQGFLASLKFTEEQIKTIIPVAMDLASATGMSLESAVRNTAKTFSGMAGELGELVPQIRTLTKEQMMAGDAVKIMGELFGGQALAQSETMTGAIEQMKNAVGDAAEAIGTLLAPVVITVTEGIKFLAEGLNMVITAFDDVISMGNVQALVLTEAGIAYENLNNLIQDQSLPALIALRAVFEEQVEGVQNVTPEIQHLFDMLNLVNTEIAERGTPKMKEFNNVLHLTAKGVDKVVASENKQLAIKIAKRKLIIEELKQAALVQGSAEDAMKAVVRAETMEAVAGYISSVLKNVPFPLNVVLAAGGGAFASGLIDKGMAKFAQGGQFITEGAEAIVVGDNPSGRERVTVEPLGGDPGFSGSSVNINFSGNVLSQDFIEDEAIPMIKEAIRRGADIGVA